MSRDVDSIPEEELGVELDMAIGYRSRLVEALQRCHDYYVGLDGLADGDLADRPTSHLRDAQVHIKEASELLSSEKNVVESRIDALEQRIEDERDD